MKKIINRMLIVSVLSVSLAGCTKDKVSEGGILEGEPTTVELKLQFSPNNPAAMRDATTDDPNATVAEAELKTVDVFIYSGAGDYLDHVHLEAGDFTQQAPISGADVWETTTPLPTTTGPKDFYVGVNLPADAAS